MLTPGGDAAGRGERRAQGHLASGGAVKGSREITLEMEAKEWRMEDLKQMLFLCP